MKAKIFLATLSAILAFGATSAQMAVHVTEESQIEIDLVESTLRGTSDAASIAVDRASPPGRADQGRRGRGASVRRARTGSAGPSTRLAGMTIAVSPDGSKLLLVSADGLSSTAVRLPGRMSDTSSLLGTSPEEFDTSDMPTGDSPQPLAQGLEADEVLLQLPIGPGFINPEGACCLATECVMATPDICFAMGGDHDGAGTTCGSTTCSGQPVVNGQLDLESLMTGFAPMANCAAGFDSGVFTLTSTFENESNFYLYDLYFEVTILTGGNTICSTINAPGGVGSIQLVPRVDGYADGELGPQETFTATFDLGLASTGPFSFFVDIRGRKLAPI